MFYVLCPNCGSQVEVPDSVIGPRRSDRWNAVPCDLCDLAFDYDEHQIREDEIASVKPEPQD